MSNIKLRGEDILGMVLTDWSQTEEFGKQLDVAENVVFWGRGKEYKRIFEGIINKEAGFDRWKSMNEYCRTFKILNTGISNTMASYDVVCFLYEKGVTIDELPKKEYHAAKLKSHPQKNWVKLWNKNGAKLEKFKAPAVSHIEKEEDVDGFIKDAIYQIQNFTETLDKIQNLIDKGIKPEKDNALILTAALKELHDSLLELAGIE